MAIPKITVSINVVTQANTAPCRGTLSKKKKKHTKEVKRRNLASSSVLYSFRLQAIVNCMADLYPDKFLQCRVTTAVSQPKEEVVVGCFFLEKKKEKKSVA